LPDAFSADDHKVVEWRRDQVVDQDGRPLDSSLRPVLLEVAFTMSPAELNLSETVGALCRIFEGGTPQQGWMAKSLRSSLESSPAALERTLQRLLDGFAAPDELDALLQVSEEGVPEDGLAIDPNIDESAAEIAMGALQAIETVQDSKLRALGGLLTAIIDLEKSASRICVDNIFVERLWWTVKHEWVYLRPAADGIEQKRSLGEFFDWYNLRRPHQSLGWRTPDEAYLGQSMAATPLAA
jgi:hypothetical protein